MRIAFLITTSLESPYGLGRCWPFAQQLAKVGHDVHIVALHHALTPAVPRQFQREGVAITYVGQMHVRKDGDTTRYYGPLRLLWVILTGLWGLLIQALRLRADIYHIGKPHPQNSLAGMIAARWHRRRVLLDYDDLESAINRTSNPAQRQVLAWLEAHVPLWVDGVTVHSHFLEERLLTLGIDPARILRLPSCVDQVRFQAMSTTAVSAWQTKLRIEHKRVILYVGTLALVNHPVDLLLHAFQQLCAQRDDVVLVLVGGGADLAKLQALADQLAIVDHCRFVGRVAPEDVPLFFHLADLSVDPVHDDLVAQARWPLKIVESLAAGLPVITGDVGDRCEMLGQGAAGMVVTAGSATALAEAITKLLDNPSLQTQLKEGCVAQMGLYDCVLSTERLITFYRSILAHVT